MGAWRAPAGWGRRVTALGRRALHEHLEDHGPQLAAAISYHALFSLFPLAILLTAVLGLVLRDDGLRDDLIRSITGELPLDAEGRRRIADLVEGVAQRQHALGLLGLAGLLWAGSGVMGALRLAMSLAWDAEPRPFVRGKLFDLAMMLVAGVLALASLGATIALRIAPSLGSHVDAAAGVLAPMVLSAVTFTLMYRFLPAAAIRLRDVWPGVLVATAGFEGLKWALAAYLSAFGRYDVVYGSLGAVVALMLFIYLSATIAIFGAEVASEWMRRRGATARPAGRARSGCPPGPPEGSGVPRDR